MSEISAKVRGRTVYYVYGSGLMGIPYHTMNEVPRMRAEFHANEAKRAMLAAWARKPA
ncbi:MAG: hypothetical protein KGI26_00730 [Thaumarchaeota archaeon]|nr:hypothetical protein [Nitrososphaerota archaeon]